MSWHIHPNDAPDVLTISFDGYLGADPGKASAKAVAERLREGPKTLVFEVSKMRGYHRAARYSWQVTLWPLRANIREIVVVGGNKIITMGASVIAMFLGVPMTKHQPNPPTQPAGT